MYGLCQETHWDWIDLDDMNNLADTKGGNINAHIYSNLSAVAGAWMPCSSLSLSGVGDQQMHLREELIQKCIFAWELFTYRCMIMIPRLIRDKSHCLLPSVGVVKVTCFFPADLSLDSGLISQLIPWCLLTPEWCFLFFPPSLWTVMQETCETAHREHMSYLCPHLRHQNPGFSHKNASNSLFFLVPSVTNSNAHAITQNHRTKSGTVFGFDA